MKDVELLIDVSSLDEEEIQEDTLTDDFLALF